MEPQNKRRSLTLVAILLVVCALVGAFVVMPNGNGAPQGAVQAHELVQQGNQADMDVPDNLQVTGDVADVEQEIGEKESMMKDAEILSDAAVTEADEIAMDQADHEEEEEPVLVDEKEDGEEEDKGMKPTEEAEDDDADLDFLSDEEAAKHAVTVDEDRYPRPQCRRVRRCYHKYCSKRRCKRVCPRKRICRRIGRIFRCIIRPACYTHCSLCRSRCGVICRLFSHCRRVPRIRCYNRYCVRRFCQRRCVRKGVRCRRYRRCFRRCVGVCGRRDRRCRIRCFNYKRCRPLNRCYNRCFRRRAVCGRRCVRR